MAPDGFKSDNQLAQEFSKFYLRFDGFNFSNEILNLINKLSCPGCIPFDVFSVARSFKLSKAGKSPGLDNISGRLLSSCADQLAPIFYHIFQLSLNQQRVPKCWKQSTVIPVAKTTNPRVFNDFRPVALTSLVMKSFEKLIKRDLIKTEHLLDPQQFAYRAGRGVEDATATLLNLAFKQLEGNKNHVKLLFLDFSSAFNTIQPHILIDKLLNIFNLHFNIVGWILDFLTSRTQRVRENGCLSGELTFIYEIHIRQ